MSQKPNSKLNWELIMILEVMDIQVKILTILLVQVCQINQESIQNNTKEIVLKMIQSKSFTSY